MPFASTPKAVGEHPERGRRVCLEWFWESKTRKEKGRIRPEAKARRDLQDFCGYFREIRVKERKRCFDPTLWLKKNWPVTDPFLDIELTERRE